MAERRSLKDGLSGNKETESQLTSSIRKPDLTSFTVKRINSEQEGNPEKLRRLSNISNLSPVPECQDNSYTDKNCPSTSKVAYSEKVNSVPKVNTICIKI